MALLVQILPRDRLALQRLQRVRLKARIVPLAAYHKGAGRHLDPVIVRGGARAAAVGAKPLSHGECKLSTRLKVVYLRYGGYDGPRPCKMQGYAVASVRRVAPALRKDRLAVKQYVDVVRDERNDDVRDRIPKLHVEHEISALHDSAGRLQPDVELPVLPAGRDNDGVAPFQRGVLLFLLALLAGRYRKRHDVALVLGDRGKHAGKLGGGQEKVHHYRVVTGPVHRAKVRHAAYGKQYVMVLEHFDRLWYVVFRMNK